MTPHFREYSSHDTEGCHCGGECGGQCRCGRHKPIRPRMDFGEVIRALKSDPAKRFARAGWNGRGIWISLQVPDKHSMMTHPYIYMDTTGLQSDNPDAPRDRVPWLASQTDMLADDWEMVE